MIVSRPEFVRRFVTVFGDIEDGEQYLFCFRTKMPDGGHFYAAPFVISKPLDLYYHLCNVDGVVIDKLVEQFADVCQLAYWSDAHGLYPLGSRGAVDLVCMPFVDLYLTNEEVSE